MTMTEELVITKHAYTRMKERNGWNKKCFLQRQNVGCCKMLCM